MSNKEGFRIFLLEEYKSEKTGVPYSKKVVSDILSRCRKIESVLNISLPLEEDADFFKTVAQGIKENQAFSQKYKYAYAQYIHALNVYRKFCHRQNK